MAGVFLPYQRAIMAAMNDLSHVTVWEKSRRIGATWALAGISTLKAAETQGQSVFYMTYNKDLTREFIDYCAHWARALELAAGQVRHTLFKDPKNPERDLLAFSLHLRSGHKVMALPSKPRAFRGHQGIALLDEAAFHDDLDAAMKAALAFRIWGGGVMIVSTHFGVHNPFNRLCEDIRSHRKSGYRLLRTTFDDAIRDGLYQRVRAAGKTKLTQRAWRRSIIEAHGEAAGQELFCIPNAAEQAWLPLGLIEEAVDKTLVPVLRFDGGDSAGDRLQRIQGMAHWLDTMLAPHIRPEDQGQNLTIGADLARSGDTSVLWALRRTGLHRNSCWVLEFSRTTFAEQDAALRWIIRRFPRLECIALDATGLGAHMAESVTEHIGTRSLEVKLSIAWYRKEAPPLRAAFEDHTITIPHDHELMEDLRMVRLNDGVAHIPQGARHTSSSGAKRHGDGAVALMLAFAASRKNHAPRYEFMPLNSLTP